MASISGSSERLFQLAEEQGQIGAAAAGSAAERNAGFLRDAIIHKILPTFEIELRNTYSTNKLIQDYKKYKKLYRDVPTDHFLESTYLDMSNKTQVRLLQLIKNQAFGMNANQKYLLMERYEKDLNDTDLFAEVAKVISG